MPSAAPTVQPPMATAGWPKSGPGVQCGGCGANAMGSCLAPMMDAPGGSANDHGEKVRGPPARPEAPCRPGGIYSQRETEPRQPPAQETARYHRASLRDRASADGYRGRAAPQIPRAGRSGAAIHTAGRVRGRWWREWLWGGVAVCVGGDAPSGERPRDPDRADRCRAETPDNPAMPMWPG